MAFSCEGLISGGVGRPEWAGDDLPGELNVFESVSFADVWEDARMIDVVQYLKGNRGLKLPAEWQSVIPDSL